jgi:hypothetical protein
MLQVDPIQSYLNLKMGLPPVLKAGSSVKLRENIKEKLFLPSFKLIATKKNQI